MCRHDLAVGDATIELRLLHPALQDLLSQVPILALPLAAVAHLLRATRQAGELFIGVDDLEMYCRNALSWSYERDKVQRGVSVLKAGHSGKQTKAEFFMHIHRRGNGGPEIELPKRYLRSLLRLRQAVFSYKSSEDYDVAAVVFARPISGRVIEDSLAHSLLGFPELDLEQPLAGDAKRLLAKIAALDRIEPSILACLHDRNSARPSTGGTGTGSGVGGGGGGGAGSGTGGGEGGGTGNGAGGGEGSGTGGGEGGGTDGGEGRGKGHGTGRGKGSRPRSHSSGDSSGDSSGGGEGRGKGRGKGRRKAGRPRSGDSSGGSSSAGGGGTATAEGGAQVGQAFTPAARHADAAPPAAPVAIGRPGGAVLPAEALFTSPACFAPTARATK